MKTLIEILNPKLLLPEEIDERYSDSPFLHLKSLLAKQRGKRYEEIVIDVMTKLGHQFSKRTNTDNDAIFNGIKYEIKGSMLNKGKDVFSFLQIRPKQDYERLLFALFYPKNLVLMEMNKDVIHRNVNDGIFKPQHGGKKGMSSTYMYYGNRETLLKIGATIINEI